MKHADIVRQINEGKLTLEQVKKLHVKEAKILSAKVQKCKANKAKK